MSSSFLSNLPFLLNTETAVSQYGAELTALPVGRFVATWLDNSEFFTDGSCGSIRMQIFDANGRKTVPETIVREYRAGEQESLPTTPEIMGLDDGGFAITWSHHVSFLNTVTFCNPTIADLDHADMFSFDDTSLLS